MVQCRKGRSQLSGACWHLRATLCSVISFYRGKDEAWGVSGLPLNWALRTEHLRRG
jgi:hypothetical protein